MFKSLVVALLSLAVAAGVQAQELPRTPAQVAQALEKNINANNLDGLMKLYAKNAVFVQSPGVLVDKPEQIREALKHLLAPKLPFKATVRHIYQGKGVALIIVDWVMKGNGPDGKWVEVSGTSTDVVTKGTDGVWRYSIDNPFGVAIQP